MLKKDDRIRLQHMGDAAREAINSVQGRTRADLDKDSIWMLGLVKCVEIIGEAAARVSKEIQCKYATIPWTQIVAMRNRLVHVYFDIDADQVWLTVTQDLPILLTQIESILAAETRG
jgi:uncharacterized protein with HEPN domain